MKRYSLPFTLRLCHRLTIGVAACLVIETGDSAAETPVWPAPVQRRTTDRHEDLFQALLDRSLAGSAESKATAIREARQLCDEFIAGSDSKGDEAARWRIHLSQLKTSELRPVPDFSETLIADASRPVTELLESYPDHPRQLFLAAQLLDVRRQAARHDAVAYSVARHRTKISDRGLSRLTRITSDLQDLATETAAQQALLDAASLRPENTRRAADLMRLRRSLLVQTVQAMLLQTELLDPGSRDFLAAASQVETAADGALAVLPNDSEARQIITRLKIDAVLRSGQGARADSMIRRFTDTFSTLSPEAVALQIRIDLANDRDQQAYQKVGSFYGATPVSAPLCVDVDLAALQTLIALNGSGNNTAQNGQHERIARWMDVIEQRGGVYARRRAEAITLQLLKSSISNTSPTNISAALVAAQGEDWLRRGDFARAAELLAEAARNERDSSLALTYAAKSAAASAHSSRTADAATLLKEVALTHATSPNAVDYFMQALLLDSKGPPEATLIARLEEDLRELMTVWPTSKQAPVAQQWLVRILKSQTRLLDAAESSLPLAPDQTTPTQNDYEQASQLWIELFKELNSAENTTSALSTRALTQRFVKAIDPHHTLPSGRDTFRRIAAFCLDRSELATLSRYNLADPPVDAKTTPFAHAFLRYRTSWTPDAVLQNPPPTMIRVAIDRLMRDGRLDRSARPQITAMINSWTRDGAGDGDSLNHAERLAWNGETKASSEMIARLAAKSDTSADLIRESAQRLTAAGDDASRAAAVDLWDQLAAGTTRGSQRWHVAKLGAIETLVASNRSDEARKRARYVLLTSPPSDVQIRQRYVEASK